MAPKTGQQIPPWLRHPVGAAASGVSSDEVGPTRGVTSTESTAVRGVGSAKSSQHNLYHDLAPFWRSILFVVKYASLFILYCDLALGGAIWTSLMMDRSGEYAIQKIIHKAAMLVATLVACLTGHFLYDGFRQRRRTYIDYHDLPNVVLWRRGGSVHHSSSITEYSSSAPAARAAPSLSLTQSRSRSNRLLATPTLDGPMIGSDLVGVRRAMQMGAIPALDYAPRTNVWINYTNMLRLQLASAVVMLLLSAVGFLSPLLRVQVGSELMADLHLLDPSAKMTINKLAVLIRLDDIYHIQTSGSCCGYHTPEDWLNAPDLNQINTDTGNGTESVPGQVRASCPKGCYNHSDTAIQDGACKLNGCEKYINGPIEDFIIVTYLLVATAAMFAILSWTMGHAIHQRLRVQANQAIRPRKESLLN